MTGTGEVKDLEELRCAYCGGPAEGNYSIHRDGFGLGPEVDLCDAHGSEETPTCEEIWSVTQDKKNTPKRFIMKNRHIGLHEHRLKREEEENRFARAWTKHNKEGRILDHLLDVRPVQTGQPKEASDRDCRVAATVIQWLGSSVGQGFLGDLGYTKFLE